MKWIIVVVLFFAAAIGAGYGIYRANLPEKPKPRPQPKLTEVSYVQPVSPAVAAQHAPPTLAQVDALVYRWRPDGTRWFSGVTDAAKPLIHARVRAGLIPFTIPPNLPVVDNHPLEFF